ncbi:hypothetical protein [Granulicella arctica]|uniref:hypothetical protein n=1 Tax=Granulicella arctica TaxID=940613 RepID=UPI0021E0A9ED|nr:hypothetical protein [Granulicella arctica]
MSTQVLPSISLRKRVAYDRRFYLTMAIAAFVLIFVGFSRTYYLKAHFPMSPALSLLVHIHGFVFTTWMLYFVLQNALIAVNRPSLHRKLGISGAFLGSAVILLGLVVAFTAVRLHHGGGPYDAETIFLVGLVDLFTFALFFVTGYLYRRDREAHQRLMMMAVVIGLIGPALGRLGIHGVPPQVLGPINLAFMFAGPVYDLVTRRRVHRVYIYGVLFGLATFTPLRFALGATPWWHHMAHLIAGM